MGRTVDLDDILDAAAVAEIVGIGTGRSVSTYRTRYDDFPAPILSSNSGRCQFWLRQDVEAWHKKKQQERGRL